MSANSFFGNYPHMFKVIQLINAVILLMCLSSASSIDGNGVLWFVATLSLLVSITATILFAMDQHNQMAFTISNGVITWNIIVKNLYIIKVFRNLFIHL